MEFQPALSELDSSESSDLFIYGFMQGWVVGEEVATYYLTGLCRAYVRMDGTE